MALVIEHTGIKAMERKVNKKSQRCVLGCPGTLQ